MQQKKHIKITIENSLFTKEKLSEKVIYLDYFDIFLVFSKKL